MGTTEPGDFGPEPFTEFTDMVGLPELLEQRARYAPDDDRTQ